MSFLEDTFKVNNREWLFYSKLNSYTRDEMEHPLFEQIEELNEKVRNLSGYLLSTYCLKKDFNPQEDPEFPEQLDIGPVNGFTIPEFMEDVDTTPLIECKAELSGLYGDMLLTIDNSEALAGVNRRVKKVNELKDATDVMQWFKRINSYVKIKFKTFDPFKQEYIQIDKVTIEGKQVDLIFKEDEMTYYIEGVFPNVYVMKVMKSGYIPVVFTLESKFAENVNEVSLFNMGSINMLSIHSQLRFVFTWGEQPEDLDTHVFSFDEHNWQIEHAYFQRLQSKESGINIDHDDVDSWGPEITEILVPKDNRYYLFSIHNYTLHYYQDPQFAHMNFGGLTNVRAELYGHYFDVKPTGDSDNFWWDVLVVYNDKIYVIDEYPNRHHSFSYILSPADCRAIIQSVRNCTNVVNISEFKPTTIRFYE